MTIANGYNIEQAFGANQYLQTMGVYLSLGKNENENRYIIQRAKKLYLLGRMKKEEKNLKIQIEKSLGR